MAERSLNPPRAVDARVLELMAAIEALRPDSQVQLVPKSPRSVSVLSGAAPRGAQTSGHQPVAFYSKGQAIAKHSSAGNAALIASHPLFERILALHGRKADAFDADDSLATAFA